ncbi:hypothetical protein [Microbacterium maritypicum]
MNWAWVGANSGWIWNALAGIGAVAAVLVAVQARKEAKEANRLVGVYKRPLLTVDAGHDPAFPSIPRIRITNRGESPALNVRLVLDADPLHLWVSGDMIPLIAPGGFETIALQLPQSPHSPSDPGAAWVFFFMRDGARQGRVHWTDLEARQHNAPVMVPTEWKTAAE